MDEQRGTGQQMADTVVEGINKEFVIVGKHRLHGWYAWAIVGVMIGMFLGIVYVANRSNDALSFPQSEAAGGLTVLFKSPAPTSGTVRGVIVRSNDNAFLAEAAHGSKPVVAGAVTTMGTGIGLSESGVNIMERYGAGNGVGVLYVNANNSAAWVGKRQGQTFSINTNTEPAVDTSRNVILTFENVYVNPKGVQKSGVITGNFYGAFDLGTAVQAYDQNDLAHAPLAMNGYSRVRPVNANQQIAVLRGMPLYLYTPLTLQVGDKKFGDRTLVLPGQKVSGTWKLTWKDRNAAGVTDGDVEVVKKEFIPAPNQNPVLSAVSDQTVQAGSALTFTVTATDPDGDPVTLIANSLPSGATFNNGVFSWTPAQTTDGYSRTIRIRAADDRSGFTEKSVKITVVANPAKCADGIDNDQDGKVDMADPGCSGAKDNDETDPPQSQATESRTQGLTITTGLGNKSITFTAATIEPGTATGPNVVLNRIRLDLSGFAPPAGSSEIIVTLRDTSAGTSLGQSNAEICTFGPSANYCTVTFTPQYTLSAGTAKTVQVVVSGSVPGSAPGKVYLEPESVQYTVSTMPAGLNAPDKQLLVR